MGDELSKRSFTGHLVHLVMAKCYLLIIPVDYSGYVKDKYQNYNKHAIYFANTYFQAASRCIYLTVLRNTEKSNYLTSLYGNMTKQRLF
jgi:hypothetical protein